MAFLHGRPARDRGAHALLPGASAGEVEVEHVEDPVADRVQELVLVLDVRVEGWPFDAEFAAETAHAERVHAFRVDELERLVDDALAVEARRSPSSWCFFS